ncbi:transcriptional regulator [Cellulomonas oligotrophica]|uniref:Transcriptional regulator n=1 Tax=Cellulomonas oligotrophica TaxID=931536 RepID=A0A7Y9FE32_9CELL|nr:transcriptional regulator [Cellulomonas oligotrophica]NYD85659.1 DNA-binding MarR family transcriptional regulator [Cellulomonas oligotrophica]GIG31333.1 transcriptional regulator [Cellulomonas oligotrophica]
MSDDDRHPLADLDETVHQRARLGILAVLVEHEEADFTRLKRALGLTDGNLGRHLEVLVDAGHVELRKGSDGRRARTWARITPQGERALAAEVDLLRRLLRLSDPPHTAEPPHACQGEPR